MKNIKKAKIKAYDSNDEMYMMIDDNDKDFPKSFEDKYKFHIDKDSDEYKLSKKYGLEYLEDLYDGSTFIIEDGNIVDFRDNCYDGYYNSKVKKVAEIIGYTKDVSPIIRTSLKYWLPNKNYILGKQYNKRELIVNDIVYETGLWYIYNPFIKHIKMIPYISNVDGMFCYHQKTVKHRYDNKYIEGQNTFENKDDEWMMNLYDAKLSLEINDMFKTLLDGMNNSEVSENLTALEMFNNYLKMLTSC
jgi:hypothetical protein